MLFVLGFTGAFGQVFVFVTISKFGALNCALIGLGRKILSLLLSFILYGHSMNGKLDAFYNHNANGFRLKYTFLS